MKTKYIVTAFALTAMLQLFAPLKLVYNSEMTARYGTVYKFKTQPIDPSDPFRGKYVSLNFEVSQYQTKQKWITDEELYVVVGKDSLGYAKITNVLTTEPATGSNYLKAKAGMYYDGLLHIDLPFNQFYMEEGKAQEAEDGYRKYNLQDNAEPAYATVAIKNGNAVITNVIVNGLPIRDYVLRERSN
jgi:uncharacterized membrane-anchored protein